MANLLFSAVPAEDSILVPESVFYFWQSIFPQHQKPVKFFTHSGQGLFPCQLYISPDQLRSLLAWGELGTWGGDEHNRLCCPDFNPQVFIETDDKGVKFMLFNEDLTSKTNQGGLSGCKCKPRQLKIYGSDVPA